MEIRIVGDPVLRQKADAVTEFGDPLESLAGEMISSMLSADGIGLAAPQVGISKRFIVIGLPVETDGDDFRHIYTLANPELLSYSEDTEIMEEGCLSIPGINEEVERPAAIKVRFQSLNGDWKELETSGVLARVIQHEMDHLEGVLFIDHLSALKRTMLKSKLKKLSQDAVN